MDLRRAIFCKRYIAVIVLIVWIMLVSASDMIKMSGGTVNIPYELLEILFLDRFKPMMVVLLSGIYGFGLSDELNSTFHCFIWMRCDIKSYLLSKIIANFVAVTGAVIISFYLFCFLMLPFGVYPTENTQKIYGYYSAVMNGNTAWLYPFLSGLLFALFVFSLIMIGMWFTIKRPNRYVAISIPFASFYVLYALTSRLPIPFQVWYISSGIQVLKNDSFWVNYLYGISFFLVWVILMAIFCYRALCRRVENGEL